jgi:hypothetical protein
MMMHELMATSMLFIVFSWAKGREPGAEFLGKVKALESDGRPSESGVAVTGSHCFVCFLDHVFLTSAAGGVGSARDKLLSSTVLILLELELL